MNTVVYYPHISPTIDWLKLAALSWDKVYRIRPIDAPDDPKPIKDLDQLLGGILETVKLDSIALSPELLRNFKKWVDTRTDQLKMDIERSGEQTLVALYKSKFPGIEIIKYLCERGLARVKTKPEEIQIPKWSEEQFACRHMETDLPMLIPEPGSDHEKYEKIMEEKFEKWLEGDFETEEALKKKAKEIRERNLIKVTDYSQLVYLPKIIALHYLSLCASMAASDKNRDMAADGEEFSDTVFHNVRSLRGEVSTSLLQAYLPKELSDLSPERIAEFRIEFASQRLKYQKAIQSLVDEFESVASEGELGKLKQRIVDLAEERIDETKKSYQHAKVNLIIKTFGVSLTPPAIATTIASLLGIGIFAPAGVAAAISLFGAKSLLEWEKAKLKRSKSPWSYVIEAGSLR